MFWKLVPVYFLRCSKLDLLPYPSLLSLMGLELDFIYVVPFLVTIAITIKALLIIYLCQVFLIFTNQHFLRASHHFLPPNSQESKWCQVLIILYDPFQQFYDSIFLKVFTVLKTIFYFFLIGITFLILKITVVSIGSAFPY